MRIHILCLNAYRVKLLSAQPCRNLNLKIASSMTQNRIMLLSSFYSTGPGEVPSTCNHLGNLIARSRPITGLNGNPVLRQQLSRLILKAEMRQFGRHCLNKRIANAHWSPRVLDGLQCNITSTYANVNRACSWVVFLHNGWR